MTTIPGFYGREDELAWLRSLWDQATVRDDKGKFIGGPRMAIVSAETGYGKTRLVQAFYQSLTIDPVWDPPTSDYWPDTFRFSDREQVVNPDLADHKPKGPPQFLWMATRWNDPSRHNPNETVGILEIRERLLAHVQILHKYRDSWSQVKRVSAKAIRHKGGDVATDVAGDLTENAIYVVLPLGGLLTKFAKAGFSLVKGGLSAVQALTTVAEQLEKSRQTACELVLEDIREVFGGFGSGGLVLPTVLFFDDAQWIDPVTLRFIHLAWDSAAQNNWPLLIVICHWEREWNELAILKDPERDGTLARYRWVKGAENRVLPSSKDDDLRAYLVGKFPGLTLTQQSLLLEKAGGNFWTMVLNAGALGSDTKRFFVRGDLSAHLTAAGERWIASWESEREKRIEQRFFELDPAFRDVLAWSSRMGQRFLPDVVTRFAKIKVEESVTGVDSILDTCVDRLAVLSRPSNDFCEFRDRAFYAQACKRYDGLLAVDDEVSLAKVMRASLADWINRSFDRDGGVLGVDLEWRVAEPAAEKSLVALSTVNDVRDLLALARKELPLDVNTWTDDVSIASIRGLLLHVICNAGVEDHPRRTNKHAVICQIDWSKIPDQVVGVDLLFLSAQQLMNEGMFDCVDQLLQKTLSHVGLKNLTSPLPIIESLEMIAAVRRYQGRYDDADSLLREAFSKLETDVAVHPALQTDVLTHWGVLSLSQGKYADAETRFLRALEIHERNVGTDDVIIASLLAHLALVKVYQSELPAAESNAKRALAISENIGGPNQVAVGISLCTLGSIQVWQGYFDDAESYLLRALQVFEQDVGTSHLIYAKALTDLGQLYLRVGRYQEAQDAILGGLQRMPPALGEATPDVACLKAMLGAVSSSKGNYSESERWYSEALDAFQQNKLTTHPHFAATLLGQAELFVRLLKLEQSKVNCQRAQMILSKVVGSTHPDLVQCVLIHGIVLLKQGNHSDAEHHLLRALHTSEQSAGNNPVQRATILYSLGQLYLARDDIREAERRYGSAVEISMRLSAAHPLLARCLNDFALVKQRLGSNGEAEAMYLRAIEIFETACGEHPDLATALGNLADLYQQQRRFAEVETLIERALKMREKLGGDADATVGLLLNNLALVNQQQGKSSDAEVRYKRAVEILEKVYGSEHLELATLLGNLAELYLQQRRFADAEPLFERALKMREKLMSDADVAVGLLLNNLAVVNHRQGKSSEAEARYKRAIEILEKVFGSDHLELANSLGNLAEFYRQQSRFGEAEPLFERALNMREKLGGEADATVGFLLGYLAIVNQQQGKSSEAEARYKRAVEILETVYGSEHLELANMLGDLAELYRQQSRFAEAEPLFERALNMREKLGENGGVIVGVLLNNLALVNEQLGKSSEAEARYKRAIEILEMVYGNENFELVTTLGNLAELYWQQTQFAKAESLFVRAVKLLEKRVGSQHLELGPYLDRLVDVYTRQEKHREAEEASLRVIALIETAVGSKHLALLPSLDRLSLIYGAMGQTDKSDSYAKRAVEIRNQSARGSPDHIDS